MRTLVKIPQEKAPEDPEWLLKKHERKRLNPLEAEEYYKYLYERDHQRLLVDMCPARYSPIKR
jgi:hypothetical protein